MRMRPDEDQCAAVCARLFSAVQSDLPFDDAYLEPVGPLEIISRMLATSCSER